MQRASIEMYWKSSGQFFFTLISLLDRIMVGLPSAESREKILRTLLAKEKVEQLDFKELATMTEGYSGSDLKVCCT